jgi:regulator of protease activity HflC (stomatin/prohibitin superfamily)
MLGEMLLIFGIFFFIWAYNVFSWFRIFTYAVAAVFFIALFFKFFIKKYDDYERAVIFRLGKFHRIAGPGWSVVIPFFEKEFQKLDVRTSMIDVEIPLVFTKDDLRLKVDSLAYYRVVDPGKAVLQIDNYQKAIQNLLISQIRNVMGNMYMRDLFSKLDNLNDLVKDAIRRDLWRWGIDIPSLQLRSLSPPEEIATAMQQKEIAAQQLQAQRLLAEAKRVMIEAVGEAAKNLDDRAIMYFYIKALEELGKGSATKIIFPAQFLDVLQNLGKNSGAVLAGAGIGLSANEVIDSLKDKIAGG